MITPNGKTAYVANGGSGTVTPIRTGANTALKAIKVGSEAGGIAITPNGKTAYVDSGEYTVVPFHIATNTAGKAIKVLNGPEAIAITPNGKTVYVSCDAVGSVIAIRTATNKVQKVLKGLGDLIAMRP